MTSARGASPTAPARQRRLIAACLAVLVPGLIVQTEAVSNQVEIVSASVDCRDHLCRFEVTLSHQDEGWDHYADYWRILDAAGNELGRRVLFHPHVHEQPFTRSLSDIKVPSGVDAVWIKAHDSVHGENASALKLEIPK